MFRGVNCPSETVNTDFMRLKKGNKLIFKNRTEVVIKANNDPIKGTIETDLNKYSTDFINRWLHYGFVKIG